MRELIACRQLSFLHQLLVEERLCSNALLELKATQLLFLADVATKVTDHLLDGSLPNQKLSPTDLRR